MGTNNVHIKEAVVVTPAEPTPSRVLTLSSLDSQLFLRFSIEYLLIYRPDGGCDRAGTSARVKSALSRALVPYYPLAGRVIRPNKQCLDPTHLEVLCRGQGAVFLEAVSEHTASEFERAPRYVSEWRKLLSLHVGDVLKGAPPVVVQLTWLRDGDAALGVGINHCLTDGIGSAEFLNHFAELAAGKRGTGCSKPKPIWERHVFDPIIKPGRIVSHNNHPEFNRVPDVSGFTNRFSTERLVPTSVTFGQKSVAELRKVTTLSSPKTTSYTSFEVVSAHVWRSWVRGMNLSPTQTVKLLFSVNVRGLVKPALPVGYYGNAFVLGCAQTSVKDMTEKGLGHVAGLVKRAKQRIDDDHVRSVVESVSGSRACPDSVGVLILSQWSRLGLERVDFGLGRPVQVRPVCSDRYCLMLPVCDQTDAMNVMVAVPASSVDRYEYLIRSPYS